MGKSVLLEHVVGRASGWRVLRAVGVQSEMELAFAGLQQLCAPMLSDLERLPVPQREALGVAFGLTAGAAPDRFLVGLAVLGLLSEVAGPGPVVCLVDDAQWLDRASLQSLEFVARRLLAESVALVFAVRQTGSERLLAGLPELVVGGLRDRDARALLGSVIRWPLDDRVRDRIVAETRGQPAGSVGTDAWVDAGGTGGRVRAPDRRGSLRPHRGQLPQAAGEASGEDPAAVAAGGGGTDRRFHARVGGGRTAWDRSAGGRCRRVRGILGVRHPDHLPSSARPLRHLHVGLAPTPAGGAWRAGEGDRSAARSRSARLAPRAGGARAR